MGSHQSRIQSDSKRRNSKHSLFYNNLKKHRKESTIPDNSPVHTDSLCQNSKEDSADGQHHFSKYIFPHDEKEQDRLTQVHFLYKYLFKANCSAPVKDLLSSKPQSKRNSASSQHTWFQEPSAPLVLDIACGNGTWVLEMATEFPNSQFYGIDIVANYPTTVKPPNAHFVQLDILDPHGLPYPNEYFDYIHMRQVYACFSEDDWKILMQEIKRLLKPGGYVEIRDLDPVIKNVNKFTPKPFKGFSLIMKESLGINVLWARYMYDFLKDVGEMSEMQRTIKRLNFHETGPIGNMIHTSFRAAMDNYKPFFIKYYNVSLEDYDSIVTTIINHAVKDQSYFEYYCCWGRKSLLSKNVFHHVDITDQIKHPLQKQYSLDESVSSQHHVVLPRTRSRSFHIASFELLKQSQTDHVQTELEYGVHPFDRNYVSSLATDSVCDINQFSEGFED